MDVKLDVDYRQLPVEEGDVYLLSTDGLHDVLPQTELKARMLTLGSDLEVACDEFCQRALEQGSTDNISCQLLRIEALPPLAMDEVVGRMTQLSFPPFLEAGMKLDGYRVKRELHASNRSQVYLVEDEASGKLYCMKTPSVNFDDDPAYIERFVMESWIGSRISSPYVVKVYEAVRNRSCLYYLTEYVDGMSLTQWMRENPKPPIEEVVYLVDQIAKGLRAFHRRETLHSDIKPDNVMIDSQGRVKIIDFGACHVAGIAEIATPFQRDIALGTASYSAPEYSLGKLPNYRADLFSLAVICYEMLTGALPFEGKLENCKSQGDFLNTRYIPSYQLNPLVPVWIDGALRKGLRFYEERRHQEVSEFVYELQNPNPRYLEHGKRPLMERDPLFFWKVLAGGLALSQLIMLYFLQ
jgi:serine/threonine protein kinase